MSLIPFEVASVIADLNMGPLTLERRAPPTKNEHGGFDPSPVQNIVLDPVSWHTVKLDGRDLVQVPEADRNTELRQFYTVVETHVADENFIADIIVEGGRRYRVEKIHDYAVQGGVFITEARLEDPQARP